MSFPTLQRYRTQSGALAGSVVTEAQGSDYESGRVNTESGIWRVRTARITPTKPGAFVAVWRRGSDGETEPFDMSDECSGLVVFVEDGERFGVFTFSREQLVVLGIIRSDHSPGKRGFRVYPSWCTDLNARAQRTQRAHVAAFADLS